MATAPAILPEPPRHSRNTGMRLAGRFRSPDLLFEKQIDNSHLVREVDPARRRQCCTLLGMGGLAFVLLFVFALQHFYCVRYGYDIARLKGERASLSEWNQKLRLDQAQLSDPMRIDRLARQELGLASPQPEQVIRLGVKAADPAGAGVPVFARNFGIVPPAPRAAPRTQ
ncbi:MAG: cell division protein FtsL [Terriglobia bacterium]